MLRKGWSEEELCLVKRSAWKQQVSVPISRWCTIFDIIQNSHTIRFLWICIDQRNHQSVGNKLFCVKSFVLLTFFFFGSWQLASCSIYARRRLAEGRQTEKIFLIKHQYQFWKSNGPSWRDLCRGELSAEQTNFTAATGCAHCHSGHRSGGSGVGGPFGLRYITLFLVISEPLARRLCSLPLCGFSPYGLHRIRHPTGKRQIPNTCTWSCPCDALY